MFAASRTSSMLRCEILKPLCPYEPSVQTLRPRDVSRGNVTLTSVNIRQRSTRAPEGGYADLPPGVGFEPKDEPLRRDINLLGEVLGRVLIEQEGKGLFDTEEEIRLLCKRLHFGYDPELDGRLREKLEVMDVGELQRIVR